MSKPDIPPAVLLALTGAADHGCPDCDNDTRLRQDTYGIWHLDVLHDDTCPWFTRHQQRKATR